MIKCDGCDTPKDDKRWMSIEGTSLCEECTDKNRTENIEFNPDLLLEKFKDNRIGDIVMDLTMVVNKNNLDNALNTPDHIVAQHLFNHLVTLRRLFKVRDDYYKPMRLWVIGEKSSNPDDWDRTKHISLIICESKERAIEIAGHGINEPVTEVDMDSESAVYFSPEQ